MSLLSVSREVSEFRKRYKWMGLVVSLVFGALLARVVYLQVIEFDQAQSAARNNIIKTLRQPATRGIVRDHEGRVVATNRPAYSLYVTPSRLRNQRDLERLLQLLGLPPDQQTAFTERLQSVPRRRQSHQIKMIAELDRDQLAALETHGRELPAIDVIPVPLRHYPFDHLAAHAIGFLNEISPQELKRRRAEKLRAGDKVGRSGVESAWEPFLRGIDGYRRVFVDARGRRSRMLKRTAEHDLKKEAIPGRDLTLSLDMGLMRDIDRAFRNHHSGAVVVVDIDSGQVRAAYSKPSYDLNEMSGRLSVQRHKALNEDPHRPLIDKTLYDSYFPGSTFKVVSALAALTNGIMTPEQRVECGGFYKLGNRRFRCGHVHGEVDMEEALSQSCNVYFYRLAELVGMNRIAKQARQLGLGARTGIGINTETPGFIPTRDWYEQRGERFRIGYTLNAAIGQGNTRVTLIQLAMTYAALAKDGVLYVPQIVESVNSPGGEVLERFEPRIRQKLDIETSYLEVIRRGLWGVVNDPLGTAYEVRDANGVEVAGKTGTAQVAGRPRKGQDPSKAWYFTRDHAWFAGWAPARDPEIAIVVLVEHGGGGGKYAAPIAIRVANTYLGGRNSAPRPRTARAR